MMNLNRRFPVMKRSYVKQTVAVVVVLNVIQLCYFFSHRGPVTASKSNSTEHTFVSYDAKNWSEVQSFTPWETSDEGKASDFSCEGYFGNGFTRVQSVLDDSVNGGGSLKCHYSETLRTSVCEGRRIVVHPEKIDMSMGGEEIEAVRGRDENEELPVFKDGAFQVQVSREKDDTGAMSIPLDVVMPRGQVHEHTVRSLLASMRTVSSQQASCTKVITTPTLFVTRFEYANLFHTVTDWYSSYASCRVVGLEQRPAVVLLDGHCQSPMDDGWRTFFSDVKYVKHFGTERLCFDHAIFVPLGYDTTLFKCLSTGLPCNGAPPDSLSPQKTARLREFGEQFTSAFGLNKAVQQHRDVTRILFIRREDYLAHPRHTGKPETRLSNEEELYTKLQSWAAEQQLKTGRRVAVTNGLFAHMKLEEQLRAVQEANYIVGVHGAGLTHIVFARPGVVVLEILSPLFMRPHYQFISQWMGFGYHSLVMEDVTVDCDQVLRRFDGFIS